MVNSFKEMIKSNISIRKKQDRLWIFVNFNSYECDFIYTKENLDKYITFIIDIFKNKKREIIKWYKSGSYLSRPEYYTGGRINNIGYRGNWLVAYHIPWIIYRLYLSRKIPKDLVVNFIKDNQDYLYTVNYKELFFIRNIIGEKGVANTRKRKEK